MQILSFKSAAVRAAVALVAVSSASLASAVTLTYNFDKPVSTADWTYNFSLPKFNPALGTLQSVKYHLATGTTSDIWVANLSTGANGSDITATATSDVFLNVVGSSFQLAGQLEVTTGKVHYAKNTTGAPVYDGSIGAKYLGLSDSDSFDLSSTDSTVLSSFLGTNSLNFVLDFQTTHHTVATGGNKQADYFTNAYGNGYVEYNYSPAAVPEPTSMAALGLGLVAVARRRRSSK